MSLLPSGHESRATTLHDEYVSAEGATNTPPGLSSSSLGPSRQQSRSHLHNALTISNLDASHADATVSNLDVAATLHDPLESKAGSVVGHGAIDVNEIEKDGEGGVDVRQAEADFRNFERRLSVQLESAQEQRRRSSSATNPKNRHSKDDGTVAEKDVEAADDSDSDFDEKKRGKGFDLREYLTNANEQEIQSGIKHKYVGVTWENLRVDVIGGGDTKFHIRTFGTAVLEFILLPWTLFVQFILPYIPFRRNKLPTRTILEPQSGVLKPGEMCLVLGCPGSGCTTFLKSISNQREEFIGGPSGNHVGGVGGQVLYAGIDAEEMKKVYNGEVVYNMEDDIHYPTLTVSQTLSFVLSTKTPGPLARLPGISPEEFNKEFETLMLKSLNIEHTRNTLVGNEFVRGISGGERKRVSIAEMMSTRAKVQAWDNSTRGLDASTALDFVKGLRVNCDVLGSTVFVSLYQAGEGIYNLFDKVMVMDKGRQVYFGPPSEARAYFENLGYGKLPRQSTPEYLTGCTDKNERQFAPGRSAANVPSTPEALEKAFLDSSFGRELLTSLDAYKSDMAYQKEQQEAFRAAVYTSKLRRGPRLLPFSPDSKRIGSRDLTKKSIGRRMWRAIGFGGARRRSPYTLGFWGQVWMLTKRQFQLRMQDRFQLWTSFGLNTILALVIGGAFFNLPPTSAGAFTRGSVIFVAMLTTCLDAFVEIPTQMLGRPILHRQTGYGLYRPSAVAIGNTLADIPFSGVRILIFNIIIYFMSHLSRSAGGFFTYHLFNYVAFLCLQGLFRTMGALCTNFDSAFRVATFFMPNIINYSGYIIPIFEMKRWLFWIAYINPLYYAFAGCMENEFMRINLSCDGNYIAPRDFPPSLTQYPFNLGPNQACTLFGSSGGSAVVPGRNYIAVGYQFFVADLWRRNLLVVLGFFFFFQFTQCIALEFFPQYTGSSSVQVFAKENAETKKLNQVLGERRARRNKDPSVASTSNNDISKADNSFSKETDVNSNNGKGDFSDRKTFTWENLNYNVPVNGGSLRLLHDVFGYVKPGTLTALMGASGAGKTTCLDVLAQRKNIGVVSGDVLVDGRPLDADFARGTAYAEQMDVHESTATVREAMRFSAYLRQPYEVPEEEKNAYVEEIIELLELQDLAEAVVYSLSVEARKRLTIGVELASKPELLLFLDEPTSGLDGQSAWNLVRFLRKLADNGQAILCTIHQPSALLFESFDRLLLLERGGETVYFGDIGPDSSVIRDYFARNGAVCPSNVNPAEYMLEAIGAGVTPRVGDRDWKDIWLDSPEFQTVLQEITQIKAEALQKPPPDQKKLTTYATPFLYQLKIVFNRNNLSLWRQPDYVFTRLFAHASIALFVSLSLLQLKFSVRDLQYRVFGIFWVSVLPAILMSQIEPLFINNRRIFIREASSRIYSPYVFAIGQLLGEIPYSLLCALVYWLLSVWPMGFGKGAEGTNGNGFQLLMIIFVELFGITLGQLIAAISPSVQIAVLFNPFMALVLTTFAGVTIPYPTLIPFWRAWLYQITPYTRVLSAMLSTELHGLQIRCQPDEFAIFDPPSGQTCQQWAGAFVQVAKGYLNNPNATSMCEYCQYQVGDDYFTPLNISFHNRWRDAFILFAYFVFNGIVATIASRYLRYSKR